MTHEGRIAAVKDAHGYDIGFAAACEPCGWTSGDLRDTYGAAAIDLWNHIRDTKGD